MLLSQVVHVLEVRVNHFSIVLCILWIGILVLDDMCTSLDRLNYIPSTRTRRISYNMYGHSGDVNIHLSVYQRHPNLIIPILIQVKTLISICKILFLNKI
jgi:hypothetical protein